ncbi:hypothetical protein BgAZ_105760 [Babesia gibsoni]|uniref:Uncharacterized protein n=1 Tax=Babesia gibsoni TaxID=33632 RepID=A0AAD8US04_BABGI|nr:hypothetical protein BgAZ_105760 [Babesia gibsoni]
MKVISKGEPVSDEEALLCIQRRLTEIRRAAKVPVVKVSDVGDGEPMEVDNVDTSNEKEEWLRRIKKLRSFSIAKECVSEDDKSQINFLESVERYIRTNLNNF